MNTSFRNRVRGKNNYFSTSAFFETNFSSRRISIILFTKKYAQREETKPLAKAGAS